MWLPHGKLIQRGLISAASPPFLFCRSKPGWEKAVETRRQALGQLIFCNGCCCGRTDRGFPEVPVGRIKEVWKRESLNGSIQLTISGCLGPCDVPNVVLVMTPEGSTWLGRVCGDAAYEQLIQWARDCHEAKALVPLPKSLAGQELKRF